MARLRPEIKSRFVSGYAGKTIRGPKVVDLETNFLQEPYTLQQFSSRVRTALNSGGATPKS